ncbi:hypothetical protein [Mycetocola spongiae]|uniref:hypothetical protein n=1 Tax=Mycetocola spongiae TaxID=2859226 RepID=UPI001CF3535F|nr:hypothetical protein [Mycetocola spongiae]UCR89333.1 hypothetical protein KXZ72_01085 [Mycetocola spongiae]
MQLGTRWNFGGTPPAALPAAAGPTLAAIEANLVAAGPAAGLESARWTLTWLEGRARLELDDGTRVVLHADGSLAELLPADAPDPDDDW